MLDCIDYTASYESEILQLEEMLNDIPLENKITRRGIKNRLIAVREEFEEWKKNAY